MHAVATMFDVCVVVVNHGHQSAYLFGDSSHQRIYLYQKIEATHYDALLPDPTCDICSEAEAEDEAAAEAAAATTTRTATRTAMRPATALAVPPAEPL